GGDENYNIYAVDPREASQDVIPEARNITNLEQVRAQIFHISRLEPDLMFVGLNDRDKSWHDLYKLSISTGELTLIRENTNRYTSWIFDYEDNLRLATRSKEDGSGELWRMDKKEESLLYTWDILETAYPVGFDKDNRHLFMVSNVGEDVDLTQLYMMDVKTGKMIFVEDDPEGKADFGSLSISDKTLEVLATSYTDVRTRRYFKDADYERMFHRIQRELDGKEISLFSPTRDENFWLVSAYSDTDPGSVYLYDKKNDKLELQYIPRPRMPKEHLSSMQSITYPSSDGLMIQAYLTLPKGFGKENLPLVVVPHGGPWARDYWGYNAYAQFLANRGYAVLQPNFRGSTGFGKSFLNAGNKEWGDLMQDDITWGVKYLTEQGIVDENRVCIFGGSYGGYATLAGLAFTPDIYACGVSFVGPSNLITLLNSIPPYWEAGRKIFHERMGDPSSPEGKTALERQSPLFSADRIVAPLLVVQGQNDPRVIKAESDQIVVALRDRGFPVEYINAPDEGHGFARPVNNMAFVAAMEKFMAKHINGRYQESMSDEVAQRLKEITVDVNTVELPKALSQQELEKVPVPAKKLEPGKYAFNVTLELGQQTMEMRSEFEISEADALLLIRETSFFPGSDPVVQNLHINPATMQPVKFWADMPQASIRIDYTEKTVDGIMKMGASEMPLKKDLEKPLFADGPGSALMLATLPMADGYQVVFDNFDVNTQQIKTYRLKVSAGNYNEQAAWIIETTPADGSAGGMTIWVSKDEKQKLLAYSAVLPQMGGAKMMAVAVE
ncbi:MAG TPA: S9 family peptidase, partial [Bacteroidales bacterium]|nr:S9 family peptidase [Bacteroidales bacterium]